MIGGSRQSVNRLLADFVAQGLLRFEGDDLVIPDPRRLAAGGAPVSDDPAGIERAPARAGRSMRSLPSARQAGRGRPSRAARRRAGAARDRRGGGRPHRCRRPRRSPCTTPRPIDSSSAPPPARKGGGVVGLSIAAHEGIAGYVFSTGQALAVADVAADPRFERSTAERTGYVPRSLLAVPLVDGAGTIGVLELLDRRDGLPFDLADVEAATRMAAAMTAVARASRLDREAAGLLADRRSRRSPDAEGVGPRRRRGRDPRHGRSSSASTARRPALAAGRSDRAGCGPPTPTTSTWPSTGSTCSWRERERRAEAGRRRLV